MLEYKLLNSVPEIRKADSKTRLLLMLEVCAVNQEGILPPEGWCQGNTSILKCPKSPQKLVLGKFSFQGGKGGHSHPGTVALY